MRHEKGLLESSRCYNIILSTISGYREKHQAPSYNLILSLVLLNVLNTVIYARQIVLLTYTLTRFYYVGNFQLLNMYGICSIIKV